ncbi:hypothetical protein [Azospirillum picis]|uniref:Uncharacterized protein n=1 Tax=Azospirillum picis TaxID=488438 RepID=A0ABU0MIQ6_9PROT|nr:hypothetical protein [Azospirillum picis]MBP2299536.1 hypothetical protein [Azospirillum picis]MDQ0533337.1 hypothetical protein [Azospirillum picis]
MAAVLLPLAAGVAVAQTPQRGPVPLTPGSSSGADRPVVDLSLCRAMVAHRPAPDVQYRPGVDVHGRPVAPADLPGSGGAQPPIPVDLPLSVELARRMGIALPSAPGLPDEMTAAWLTVVGDQLYLNGQPMEAASEERVYAYCRTR